MEPVSHSLTVSVTKQLSHLESLQNLPFWIQNVCDYIVLCR